MNIEEYINQKKSFSFALQKWGIDGILERFQNKIDYFLNSNKFDFDEYCGSFLMSRLAIEEFLDENFFDNSQLRDIIRFDSEILEKTVKINIYNLESTEKEVYDREKYWFLFRIPKEAIYRLKLNDLVLDNTSVPQRKWTPTIVRL